MEVKHYYHDYLKYREVISPQYCFLEKLRIEYKKLGFDTWLNPYDDKRWVLTVQLEKEKVS